MGATAGVEVSSGMKPSEAAEVAIGVIGSVAATSVGPIDGFNSASAA